ncbi:MAG: hypothetical protein ABSH44_01730 [Bryobacteraceae bacterium]
MSLPITTLGGRVWELPPLILHPFNERVPASALLENSKATLMLSGLIPSDGSDQEDLRRRLLTGRYAEVRMLFFLGKDVFRWIEQCVDWGQRVPELSGVTIRPQSFAGLLTANPPEAVKEKLIRWGVADYVSIFTRAVGLNAMFVEPPAFDTLAEEFLRNYHRYADLLYECYMASQPHQAIAPANFRFDLYASGEYSRMLESEWGAV